MDFDKLLDDCATLENTVSILIRSNAKKHEESRRLQNCIFDTARFYLEESANQEQELHNELDSLKLEKGDLETEIRQFTDINNKLSDLVAVNQISEKPDNDVDICKYNEFYYNILGTINEYEQVKVEFAKAVQKFDQLDDNLHKDELDVKKVIEDNQLLLVKLRENDCLIRLMEHQNKFAEQQFDLILNQLPWEPLPLDYIRELRGSAEQSVRDLAEVLQIQAGDIEDLNDSIVRKKKKKLEVLESLQGELTDFLMKRDKAVMMTGLYNHSFDV